MARLLSALTEVIGHEPEDEDQESDTSTEPEETTAAWSAGLPTLVHGGDATFFARMTDTMSEMMRLTDGEDSDSTFDNSSFEALASNEATLIVPANNLNDTPTPDTTRSPSPDAQFIELPAIPDNHNDLLSPVDTHLVNFLVEDDTNSVDSGFEDSYKSPANALSPPPPGSTFGILRSPFGSPAARVLSPHLGPLFGRSPSTSTQQVEPQLEDDLDSPSDRPSLYDGTVRPAFQALADLTPAPEDPLPLQVDAQPEENAIEVDALSIPLPDSDDDDDDGYASYLPDCDYDQSQDSLQYDASPPLGVEHLLVNSHPPMDSHPREEPDSPSVDGLASTLVEHASVDPISSMGSPPQEGYNSPRVDGLATSMVEDVPVKDLDVRGLAELEVNLPPLPDSPLADASPVSSPAAPVERSLPLHPDALTTSLPYEDSDSELSYVSDADRMVDEDDEADTTSALPLSEVRSDPLSLPADRSVDEHLRGNDPDECPAGPELTQALSGIQLPESDGDSTAYLGYLQLEEEPAEVDGDTLNSLYDVYTDMTPSPKQVFTPPPLSASHMGRLSTASSSPITPSDSAPVASSSGLSPEHVSKKVPFGFRSSVSCSLFMGSTSSDHRCSGDRLL